MQRIHKTIPTKSRRFCSVFRCSSYSTKDISLHYFPKDPKLCKKWKEILEIAKPISKYMCVCNQHFLKEDFMPITPHTVVRRLKKGVVPSQKLPVHPEYMTSSKQEDIGLIEDGNTTPLSLKAQEESYAGEGYIFINKECTSKIKVHQLGLISTTEKIPGSQLGIELGILE